jgi:ABC-type transport system involved in cytochrome bd biosynthesis fused ATPase/permease subunit
VFSAARDHTLLLITHRSEGLDLVDRVLTLRPGLVADPPAPDREPRMVRRR